MELQLETKVFNKGSEMYLKLASKEVELNEGEKHVGDQGLLALDSMKNVGKKIVILRNSAIKEKVRRNYGMKEKDGSQQQTLIWT